MVVWSGGSVISKYKNKLIKKTHNAKEIFMKYWKVIVLFFKEKGKMKKLKQLFSKLWKYLLKHDVYDLLIIAGPFVLMDLTTRLFGSSINFYSIFSLTPRLFSLAYIILFIGISLNIKKKYKSQSDSKSDSLEDIKKAHKNKPNNNNN